MITHSSTTSTKTLEPLDFVDITSEVQEVVTASGVRHGLVTVFSLDDDNAIVVNERESGLIEDLRDAIRRLTNNGSRPAIGSASTVLPAIDGALRLGGWQRVMLVELAELTEPAEREVLVQIVGE